MSKFIFGLAIGAVAGAVTTYYVMKDKFEQMAQEEIDSVKEVFGKKRKAEVEEEDIQETEAEKVANINDYKGRLQEHGYVNYSDISKKDKSEDKDEEVKKEDKPYVIAPEDFGEFEEYETISLTLYTCGTLCDDNDEPVEDVENTVGEDSLETFGDYEDDSVFVRNDRLRCDFEILKDFRSYEDILKEKPYLRR